MLLAPAASFASGQLQLNLELYEIEEARRPALHRIVRRSLESVQRELATSLQGKLHVEFIGSDDAWETRIDANGVNGPLAEPWIAGLALLERDRMLVRLNGPGLLFSSEVVQHELAHIALHALGGRRHVPRWFHEGVAMYVAGEATLKRLAQEPGDFGQLDTLNKLNAAFQSHRLKVQRAYTSSGGFIRFLVRSAKQPAPLAMLLRRMHLGLDFSPAFTATFGMPPEDLYADYARYLESSPSRWTLFASESVIWGLISLLSMIAMGRAWLNRPQFDGDALDLEAIAAAGLAAQQAQVLWLDGEVMMAASDGDFIELSDGSANSAANDSVEDRGPTSEPPA